MSFSDFVRFSDIVDNGLSCGHTIKFGSCGTAGGPGEITHQKDPPIVAAYDHFFDYAYPELSPERLLEIGVCRGGSLAIWREFFEGTNIVGIDKDLDQLQPWTLDHYKEDSRIQVLRLTMPDPKVKDLGMFDLIIDDGEHGPDAVFPAFELCWPMLNPGGVYIVEDWHQHFLKPMEQMNHFVEKLISDSADAPVRITAYRAMYVLEKPR